MNVEVRASSNGHHIVYVDEISYGTLLSSGLQNVSLALDYNKLKYEPRFLKSITYSHRSDSYKYVFASSARERAKKYIVFTGQDKVDEQNIIRLDMLRISIQSGYSQDFMPEQMSAFKYEAVISISDSELAREPDNKELSELYNKIRNKINE